jgi:hypothetical protein
MSFIKMAVKRRRLGNSAPPIITQSVAPSFGPYVAGDMPVDMYTAGTFASSAGTITGNDAVWTINGSPAVGTDTLAEDDVVGLSVEVTDSAANERTFSYGTVTVAAAPAGMQIGFSALTDEGTTGDLYVDQATGSDANPGTFGSPKETIMGAVAIATSGQEIKVREGIYRETVNLAGKSGTSGNRTTISRYGTEEVIISAAEPLSGFVACTIADEPDVGPNWANIYKVTVPLTDFVGSNPRSANPFEDGVRLTPAISWLPNPQYPGNEQATQQWHTATATVTSGGLITGYQHLPVTDLYSAAQIENADVLFHCDPNVNKRTPVLSFTSGTINLTDQTQTYEGNDKRDNYALINLLPAMKTGQWGFREVGSDAVIYVWPNTPANINTSIEITKRSQCVLAETVDHVEIRGLILERAASAAGAAAGNQYCYKGGDSSQTGHHIKNCMIRDTYRANRDYAPLYLQQVNAFLIENTTVLNAYGQFGMMLTNGDGGRVLYSEVISSENSAYRMFGQFNCLIAFSRSRGCGLAAHANKANYYAETHRVAFWGCDFRGSSGYLTWQEASSVVVGFCDVPVKYGGDTRAILDQNSATPGQQSPATEGAYPGPCYILNNMAAPAPNGLAATNSVALGLTAETEVLYTGKNNILHGAAGVDETMLTVNGWRNNLLTSGSALAASAGTDTTEAYGDVYEDALKGDVTVKASSPTRTATTASIAAEVATLQSWFPDQAAIFEMDLTGAAFDPADPPMGPYVDPDTAPTYDAIWIDRPEVLGNAASGSLLTLTDGHLIGFPYPSRTYQWVNSTDLDQWTAISGATSATYTRQSSDIGKYVGCQVTGGGTATITTTDAVLTIASFPIADPVLALSPVTLSTASFATRQIETPVFTASNKPLLVYFALRTVASADTTATITIGTSGRTFGTGTSIPSVGIFRRGAQQTLIHGIIAPGSGSLTVQLQAAVDIASYRVVVVELDGATGFSAGTQSGSSGAASFVPSKTTTAAESIVMYSVQRLNGTNEVISVSGADMLSEGSTGGTLAQDSRNGLAWEQVPTSGTSASATFSWTTSASHQGIAIEVLS